MSRRRIERVLLVYPNQRWQKTDMSTTWNLNPYTICLLATMLKDDVDVKIVDAQFYKMSQEEFRKKVAEYNPDLVGLSMLSSEYSLAGEIAMDLIKEACPDTILVLGGVHVTTRYEYVMENHKVDYAIRGEGEYVFRDLIRHLNGEGPFPDVGVVSRKENGELHIRPATLVDDLDALPYPDYSFVDFPAYSMEQQRYGIDSPDAYPFVRMPTVRGCPVGCTFCQVEQVSGAKHRMRSAANVVRELEELKEKYGLRGFNFEDDNAFFHKRRAKELLQMMIDHKLDMKWKANGVALFALDDEVIRLLPKAGCSMLNIAIESGCPRVLKEIVQKPLDLKKAPAKIQFARDCGLYICANFVIGLPGETWDELRESLHFAETCGADYVKLFIANPLIGTKMYDMAKTMGYITGNEFEINWRYSRMTTPEFTPQDITIIRAYEWDRINFSDPAKRARTAKMMNIPLEELDAIRRQTRNTLDFTTQDFRPKPAEGSKKSLVVDQETQEVQELNI